MPTRSRSFDASTSRAARVASSRGMPNFARSWPVAMWAWVAPARSRLGLTRMPTRAPRPRERAGLDAPDLFDALDENGRDAARTGAESEVDLGVGLRDPVVDDSLGAHA